MVSRVRDDRIDSLAQKYLQSSVFADALQEWGPESEKPETPGLLDTR